MSIGNVVDRLGRRPIIVVLAGPNGAGKSTFYHAHLKPSGIRFVNADLLARDLGIDAYDAARIVGVIRQRFIVRGESFVFETVFSDPVGDKVSFLQNAEKAGYAVVVCFIGVASPQISAERVAMRVSQGGHDVPRAKIRARFPRTLGNLDLAVRSLGSVLVFENTDLRRPFRRVAIAEDGRWIWKSRNIPEWLGVIAE